MSISGCARLTAAGGTLGSMDSGRTVDVSDRRDKDDPGLSSGTVVVADRHRGLKLRRCCKIGGERTEPSREDLLPFVNPVGESESIAHIGEASFHYRVSFYLPELSVITLAVGILPLLAVDLCKKPEGLRKPPIAEAESGAAGIWISCSSI